MCKNVAAVDLGPQIAYLQCVFNADCDLGNRAQPDHNLSQLGEAEWSGVILFLCRLSHVLFHRYFYAVVGPRT